jgi:hypothetical protein
MKKTLFAAAFTAAFALVAPYASAENADVGAGQPESSMLLAQAAQPAPQAAPAQRHQRKFQLPSQRVEQRLAKAKAALKITDAQNTLWDNFAGVLRNQARAMDQRFQERHAKWEAAKAKGSEARAQRPQVSAVERLERRQQRLQDASARLNEVLAAAKPLYASFTPEQKQVADKMLARHGHRHGRHGHHMRHHAPKAGA